jgi:hypothetical protein
MGTVVLYPRSPEILPHIRPKNVTVGITNYQTSGTGACDKLFLMILRIGLRGSKYAWEDSIVFLHVQHRLGKTQEQLITCNIIKKTMAVISTTVVGTTNSIRIWLFCWTGL